MYMKEKYDCMNHIEISMKVKYDCMNHIEICVKEKHVSYRNVYERKI